MLSANVNFFESCRGPCIKLKSISSWDALLPDESISRSSSLDAIELLWHGGCGAVRLCFGADRLLYEVPEIHHNLAKLMTFLIMKYFESGAAL